MWILPTFQRPELLEQTLRRCVETQVSTPGVVLLQGVKDIKVSEYARAVSFMPQGWTWETIDENIGWAQGCNYLLEKYPDEPWYGFFYDDMNPVTEEWDQQLVQSLNERHMIVSAENNWHNPPRIQTAVLDGDLVREIGFLCLPETWACFTDDFWEELGTQLGIWQVNKNVIVETLNPRKGDYEVDAAHESAYNAEAYGRDREIWYAFVEERYREIRERVRNKFNVGAPRAVDLSQLSVFVATPSIYGKVDAGYVASLQESMVFSAKHGVDTRLQILDKCSILPHARNRLVAEFLASDCTHLLFVDDDMGWPKQAILELLAHEKDVIAAVGVTKDPDPEKRKFCVVMDPAITKYDAERGIIRVKAVGTGFMLISRACIEKMWQAYKAYAAGPPPDKPELGPISRVFHFDYESADGLWGEDYVFCRRWRELGGEIWIDPSIRLEHHGAYVFTGTYLDYLQAKRERELEQVA